MKKILMVDSTLLLVISAVSVWAQMGKSAEGAVQQTQGVMGA